MLKISIQLLVCVIFWKTRQIVKRPTSPFGEVGRYIFMLFSLYIYFFFFLEESLKYSIGHKTLEFPMSFEAEMIAVISEKKWDFASEPSQSSFTTI